MSFILDALKKSESERQRKNAPGISSIPEGGRRKTNPKWLWFAVVLLVANLGVLAALLFDDDPDDPATPLATAADGPGIAPGAAAQPPPVLPGPAPTQAAPAPAGQAGISPADVTMAPEPDTSDAALPATARPVTTAAQAGPEPAASGVVVDSLNELRARGVLNLPDLHLDIHVYSGDPAERFVFVNMKKYREKATLSEGPVVREITPNGVILDYRGTGFLLPRE